MTDTKTTLLDRIYRRRGKLLSMPELSPHFVDGYLKALSEVEDVIRKLPPEKPIIPGEPATQAYWYKPIGMMMPPEHHGRHRCSNCDSMANYERPGREDLAPYCHYCGAKMLGIAGAYPPKEVSNE